MSARKSSHRTIFLIVSSGSPLALIASSLRSTSKKPFCPMTRPLHPPITACGHRVRFVGTWREEFFEAPWTLSGILLLIVLLNLAASYGMNAWHRITFDALQSRDSDTVLLLSALYLPLLAGSVLLSVVQICA